MYGRPGAPGAPPQDEDAVADFLAPDAACDDAPGSWFEAVYGGLCSGCDDHHIEPGDTIRADGTGGYEHEDCAGDDD